MVNLRCGYDLVRDDSWPPNQARRLAKEDFLLTAFLVAGTSPLPCIQLWARCPHMHYKTHTSKAWQQRLQHKGLIIGSNAFPMYHSCPFGVGPCPRWLIWGRNWCNENQREEFDLSSSKNQAALWLWVWPPLELTLTQYLCTNDHLNCFACI